MLYSVFIDAGFLKASAARSLGKQRREMEFRPAAIATYFRIFGRSTLTKEASLLRIYWYDGALEQGRPGVGAQRRYFDSIADVAGIHLRLGHLREIRKPSWQYPLLAALKKLGVSEAQLAEHFQFRPELEQKGVDTLIVLDLVRMAERGAYDVAVLVAGDRDLAEAVRTAQDAGRTVVVAVPERAGMAKELRQLADYFIEIRREHLERMLVPIDSAEN